MHKLNDTLDRPQTQVPLNPALAAQPVDLRDPAWLTHPREHARRLRAGGRVHLDTQGLWLLFGHGDCRRAMQSRELSRDPRLSRSYAGLRPFGAGSALEQAAERFMLFNDAPVHTRLRQVVNAAFTPVATRLLAQDIERTCASLIEELPDDQPFDFMQRFAQVLPIRVICAMLGIEEGDFEATKAWSDAAASVVEPLATRGERAEGARAVDHLRAFLQVQVARRRHQPGHAVLDLMIAAQQAEAGMGEDELLANLILLFIAGHETTTNLLGNGMLAMLEHPAEMARLRQSPGLVACAIEEMLRWESPVNMVARTTIEPWRIGDLEVPAGEVLYCLIGAANHDPSAFEDPQRFDIGREPNAQLSFGGGVHYCVGAPLARLEAQIAWQHLLRKWGRIELARPHEPTAWRPMINLRGLQTLPIVGHR